VTREIREMTYSDEVVKVCNASCIPEETFIEMTLSNIANHISLILFLAGYEYGLYVVVFVKTPSTSIFTD
jgi:hypothetical protein